MRAFTVVVGFFLLPFFALSDETLRTDLLIDGTNDVRAEHHVSPLAPHTALMDAAAAKAADMAARGYFSHDTPEGENPWKWIRKQGYTFSRAAENIAVGYDSEQSVIEGWLASPGHRENLLNEKLTDIGIGVAQGMYKGRTTTYVVQLFGASSVPEQPEVITAREEIVTQGPEIPKSPVAQVAAVAVTEIPDSTVSLGTGEAVHAQETKQATILSILSRLISLFFLMLSSTIH